MTASGEAGRGEDGLRLTSAIRARLALFGAPSNGTSWRPDITTTARLLAHPVASTESGSYRARSDRGADILGGVDVQLAVPERALGRARVRKRLPLRP
jgi:hypothetical protein